MYTKNLAVAALVAAVGICAAQVQISQDGRPERIFKMAKGLDNSDMTFLKKVAVANNFEILLGKIAQENGSSEFAKEFGKEMTDDHTFNKNEAVQTAQDKGASISGEIPVELQKELNHLRNLHGDQFDQEFRAVQEQGHAAAIHAYWQEIQNGRDDDVKAMAVKQLPMVELHYKLVLAKQTMMGPTAASHGM